MNETCFHRTSNCNDLLTRIFFVPALKREIRSSLRILYLWFYLCFHYLINASTRTIFTIEKLYYPESMNGKQSSDSYLKRKTVSVYVSKAPNLFTTINSNCQ